MAEAKHPDLEGTPEEKVAYAKNAVALRPRQTLYVKITAYAGIEADKSDAFLDAVDAFERACRQADVEPRIDVTVHPPNEAQEKKEAKRREERAAYKRERAAKDEPEKAGKK